MTSETATQQFFGSSNAQHSDTTMRLILDPEDLLREVDLFLKGYYVRTSYDDKNDKEILEKVKIGEPKANDDGINSLMMWLKTKINPLVSMGNLSTDQYGDFLSRCRNALARNLMINRINYGVSLSDYTEIIDVFMEVLELFLTSPIRAGHRGAITRNTTVESKEVIEKENKKLFGVI